MLGRTIYQLKDVVKERSKGGVTFTLHVPYLEIKKGEFLAVVGPSGCGKSTLLDMLALVLQPTSIKEFSIEVELNGKTDSYSINQLSDDDLSRIRARHIGYVLQNGGLLPFLTVRENIFVAVEVSRRKIGKHRFDSLIRRLGLEGQLSKKPQFLSGGQRQRVAVARALIHQPVIILADEPTAAVDYPTALEIIEELKELSSKMNSTVVIVTHDRQLVEDLADRKVKFHLEKPTSSLTKATVYVD